MSTDIDYDKLYGKTSLQGLSPIQMGDMMIDLHKAQEENKSLKVENKELLNKIGSHG